MVIGAVMLVIAAPDVDEFGYTVDGTGDGGQAAIGGILIALGLLLTIGIQVWNRIFRMGRTGQSVGKKMLGLKLINEQTGQPIGAMQSFLRELLGGLINQVVYLSYLWMLWDDNKQTLADKIVHSTVIDGPEDLTEAAGPADHGPAGAAAAQAGESQVQPGMLRATQNAMMSQKSP